MAGIHGDWGGKRDGSGSKSTWRHSANGTKLVRIPRDLEKAVLKAARSLDQGEELVGASEHDAYIQQLLSQRRSLQDEVELLSDKLRLQTLYDEPVTQPVDVPRAIEVLRSALSLKANAGGAIKEVIKLALAILES